MKSSRAWIALYFALLSVLLLAAGWRIWDTAHAYSGTPETESAFLKNYTPVNVLNKFNAGAASYSNGKGIAPGKEIVTYTANFEGDFALCSEKFMPLMNALSDDVAAQLVASGAQIVSQIGVSQAGFHFDYKVGKTVGSLTIAPLQLTPEDPASFLGHSKPVPKCTVTVQTRIDVTEKWFSKSPA